MKKLLFFVVPVIGGLIAFYIIFARPFIAKKAEVENSLEEALDKVKRFYSSPEGPPSDELIKALETGNKILEKEYTRVRNSLYREFKVEVPEGQNPVLYFMERYYQKKREWSEYAQLKGASLPTSISGLPEELPSPEEVPKLLKNLEVADWVIKKLRISSLLPYTMEKNLVFIRKYP